MNRNQSKEVDIPFKTANGVPVAPGLQINESTLQEFRDRMKREGRPRYIEDEKRLFPVEFLQDPQLPATPAQPEDALLARILVIEDHFLGLAGKDRGLALRFACAALHEVSKLVPVGLIRA